MIVVDLNLLLYAVNEDADRHEPAAAWWTRALSGEEVVGLAWPVLVGFLRISTSPRIMPHPLSHEQALGVVDAWLAQPPVVLVQATERHWPILKELIGALGAAGNITSDAHLAALSIEHGARLCSTDNDFSRFPGVRWVNPLSARP